MQPMLGNSPLPHMYGDNGGHNQQQPGVSPIYQDNTLTQMPTTMAGTFDQSPNMMGMGVGTGNNINDPATISILDQIQFHPNQPTNPSPIHDPVLMDATPLQYSNSLLDFEPNQYINSTDIVDISLSLLESTLPPHNNQTITPVVTPAEQIDVGGDLDDNMTDSFTRMNLAETMRHLNRNE